MDADLIMQTVADALKKIAEYSISNCFIDLSQKVILRYQFLQYYHFQLALLPASFRKHRCSFKSFLPYILPYFDCSVKYNKGLRTSVLNPLSVIWPPALPGDINFSVKCCTAGDWR